MEISLCTRKLVQKPQPSIFQDENLIYEQPATRRPAIFNKPYKKPTFQIESNTTYNTSYMKFDCPPKQRFNYGILEKILTGNVKGKVDYDTIYKLSYQASQRKGRRPFIPKSCLSIDGCHDMTTVHMLSYKVPGYVKTRTCEPYRGKVNRSMPMASETVTKESYQDFGRNDIKRPLKRRFWQTKYKTDYQTITQLSYQCIGPSSKKYRCVPKRPTISAQIEKDTTASTSYRIPGRFINKKNVICE